MPELKNTRHERFAQGLAQGMSATAAYAQAGYEPSGQNAGRLTKNDEIQASVSELQGRCAERTLNTIEDIVSQLDEDRALARAKGQASAMVSATMGKAKVLGLIVEKHRIGIKSIDDMNEDELRQLLGENP